MLGRVVRGEAQSYVYDKKFSKYFKGQKQSKTFQIVFFVKLWRIFLLSLNCKNFPLIIFLLIGFFFNLKTQGKRRFCPERFFILMMK